MLTSGFGIQSSSARRVLVEIGGVTSAGTLTVTSPSARRVLVEMASGGRWVAPLTVSPSARRGLVEIARVRLSITAPGSHPPRGGCWLKFGLIGVAAGWKSVTLREEGVG